MDGMIRDEHGTEKPGQILGLWKKLRESVGVLQARTKEKVRFKVRSAEELIDKIRDKANELGILIYPSAEGSSGTGFVVEEGTLATQNLVVVAQAVEDGSRLAFYGFGLGADDYDKAGGKAGTYAFKAALVQALLAGGKDNAKALGVVDTDDTDTPIEGGVKAKTKAKAITVEAATVLFASVRTKDEYDAAMKQVLAMQPANQLQIREAIKAAKARVADEPKVSDR